MARDYKAEYARRSERARAQGKRSYGAQRREKEEEAWRSKGFKSRAHARRVRARLLATESGETLKDSFRTIREHYDKQYPLGSLTGIKKFVHK